MNSTRYGVWVVLASVGCATPMSAMRDENRRLSQSVAELRAERRSQDRKVRDLEMQVAMMKEKEPKAADPIPDLPVEVIAPPASHRDGQRVVGIAEDGTEIIYEGDAALGKPAVVEAAPVRRATYDAPPPPHRSSAARRTLPPAQARAADPAGDEAYRAAVALVKGGSYQEAITALRAFLLAHPRNEYADNAQYWLGEAFYAQKDYQQALSEFRATIETYPRGNKVPDALLKVGYCYLAIGQNAKARAVLEQVVNLYPKTEPAALATRRLETP